MRAISYLAEAGNSQTQMLIDSGIVSELTPLLSHEDAKVQSAALRVLCNVVSCTDRRARDVLECGALTHFSALLSHQVSVPNLVRVNRRVNSIERTQAYLCGNS